MKKILVSVLALALPTLASAFPTESKIEQVLNNSATGGPSVRLGSAITQHKVNVLKCKYDYSIQGGASTAAINLLDVDGSKCALPNAAVVIDGLIDVITAPTGAGAPTIAVGTGQAANDLKTATAIASYTGRVATIPVGTAAASIKMTAVRNPTMTIATNALTSGKFNVFIQYYLSN